jgi:hypothetical protein
MRKASTRMPEQGTQTPSPAPDLIPAERQPRTYIGIGTANGGTSRCSITDAPGTSVFSTIRRFSAMLRRCRETVLADPLLAAIPSGTCREVSIPTPSGHLSRLSTSLSMDSYFEDVEKFITGRLRITRSYIG